MKSGYFDRGFSKVAVFYFEIEPVPPADPNVWVIVGDLPPGYVDTRTAPNGTVALDAYVGAMRDWVDAVKAGKSTTRLIPVLRRGSFEPVEPSAEFADLLSRRLDFIDQSLLPQWPDELQA